MSQIRLDKYLADMRVGSRSEVKQYIRKGQVMVNGSVIKKPEYKLLKDTDTVMVNGQTIGYVANEYIMLNKPAGIVSATVDSMHQTVVDFVSDRARKDLFPVGRLDIDTEGLLLLTNDGALSHALLSPKKHVEKTYFVIVSGEVTAEEVKQLCQGVDIGTKEQEEWTKPAKLQGLAVMETERFFRDEIEGIDQRVKRFVKNRFLEAQEQEEKISFLTLTITEGKYHQVKRMFQACSHTVWYLKRIQMGELFLDPSLLPGEYRLLTKEEIELLKKTN